MLLCANLVLAGLQSRELTGRAPSRDQRHLPLLNEALDLEIGAQVSAQELEDVLCIQLEQLFGVLRADCLQNDCLRMQSRSRPCLGRHQRFESLIAALCAFAQVNPTAHIDHLRQTSLIEHDIITPPEIGGMDGFEESRQDRTAPVQAKAGLEHLLGYQRLRIRGGE